MKTSAADNQHISFAELPAEEQIKLLLAQNRTQQQRIEHLMERFTVYEASDMKLLSQIAQLKAQVERLMPEAKPVPEPDLRLSNANHEIERLRMVIDAMGGNTSVISNRKWFSRIVRLYFQHYQLPTDELNQFVRFMSRAKPDTNPEDFFRIPLSKAKP